MRSSSLVLSRGLLLFTLCRVRGLRRSRSLIAGELAGSPIGVESPIPGGSSHPCTAMGLRPLALPPRLRPPLVVAARRFVPLVRRHPCLWVALSLMTRSPPFPHFHLPPTVPPLEPIGFITLSPRKLSSGRACGPQNRRGSGEARRSTARWWRQRKNVCCWVGGFSPLSPPHRSPPHAVRSAQRQSDRSRPGFFLRRGGRAGHKSASARRRAVVGGFVRRWRRKTNIGEGREV